MKKLPWIPSDQKIKLESDVHPHSPSEKAELFHAFDGGSTEVEILNWLHATALMIKPQFILETGGFEGLGSVALAHACSMNGFGKVIVVENSPEQCVRIEAILEENNLSKFASVECFDSLLFLSSTNHVFDMAFFDSETSIRPREFEICITRGIIKNLAVFHDTSPYRTPNFTPHHIQQKYRSEIDHLSFHQDVIGKLDFHLSRGIIALLLKG
jgi:predicted O-methyltransferase YrrM